ncbi:transglycosylase family protein [Kitasatospora sp. NPDC085879]|uniref:transglycosylase family protein n=1 Tax=Kitasatospora sp. NPDC085879 TaxID=3154769 RepID=UPI0034465508
MLCARNAAGPASALLLTATLTAALTARPIAAPAALPIAGPALALALARAAVRPTGPAADVGTPAPEAVRDALADCESGGDRQADTGNGYYGGLQILPATWQEAGGPQYAPRPDLADRAAQITVAEEIRRLQGWQAWSGCARRIGLLDRRP